MAVQASVLTTDTRSSACSLVLIRPGSRRLFAGHTPRPWSAESPLVPGAGCRLSHPLNTSSPYCGHHLTLGSAQSRGQTTVIRKPTLLFSSTFIYNDSITAHFAELEQGRKQGTASLRPAGLKLPGPEPISSYSHPPQCFLAISVLLSRQPTSRRRF
jgi:hypothetical protein